MKPLKLLTALAATVIAITALATTANADVTTSGWGGTMEGRLEVDHDGFGGDVACNVNLTMDVDQAGAIDVTDVEAYGVYGPEGSFPDYQCQVSSGATQQWLDDYDCAQGGWYGQILGPGDDWYAPPPVDEVIEYAGTGDFEAILSACTYYDRGLPDMILRFAIDQDESLFETWSLPQQGFWDYIDVNAPFEIAGTHYDEYPNEMSMNIESVQ
jgi:hypothetical protein